METVMLNNGKAMPNPGFGVFKMQDPDLAVEATLSALEAGYRHIDTASFYQNEQAIGRAVRECGLPREEVFVTTKVWNDDQRAGRIKEAFQRSLEKLDIEYIDLYLVHWPANGLVEQSWTVMEELLASGLTKSIGVSNHRIRDLDAIRAMGGTVPVVNQVECHPWFPQQELLEYGKGCGIVLQAWGPLGQNKAPLLEEPTLVELGKKHGKSPAQIALRWNVQRGVVPLPKSQNPQRRLDNLNIFDFSLDEQDMAAIAAMNQNRRLGFDPEEVAAREDWS